MNRHDAVPPPSLGICATSRSGARHVLGLVRAAARAHIATEVFLTGEGVHLVLDDCIDDPVAAARVTICDTSYRAAGLAGKPVSGLMDKDFVAQWRNAEMVERCDRYLVLRRGLNMAKRVAVITRDRGRQFEALRSALGLLLEDTRVSLIVLDHEIENDEALLDNLAFIDEMGGARYSDHPSNIERNGFLPVSLREAGRLLGRHDLVIPY